MSSDPCSELLLLAVRYVDGELTNDELVAFECRLADDQDAREAVATAVELAGAFASLPAMAGDVLPAARPRRRKAVFVAVGLAAAACLALAAGLGILVTRPSASAPSHQEARAVPRQSEAVALAWSGLRQSGEVDLVSRTELLAWLDDSATPPATDLLASGGADDEALAPWLLEGARLGGAVKPAGAGTGEN